MAKRPGTGSGEGMESAQGELVAHHAKLTVLKTGLENLAKGVVPPENKARVADLLRRCASLEKIDFASTKNKVMVENILKYIDKGLNELTSKKDVLPESAAMVESSATPPEKIYAEKLVDLEENLRTFGKEFAAVGQMYDKDSAEMVELTRKAQELFKFSIVVRNAFKSSKEEKEEIKNKLYANVIPHIKRGVISGLPEYYKQYLMNQQFNG